MNTHILLLILCFCTQLLKAQSADDLVGKWQNSQANTQIEISKQENTYNGKITWLKEPNDENNKPKTDSRNRNPELKDRPILGLIVFKDFVYKGRGIWNSGKVYDTKTGNTYNGRIAMPETDKFNLRSFFGLAILGRTETWTRVE